MGAFSGPDVSESGLILSLDAGNNRSYSRNRFLCPGTVGPGSASDNNVTFALNGTGTFVRMGYGQVVGNYTIKPTDVVYRYAMGELGCFFHGNSITVPQGSYVNFSFDYLVTGATTYPIANYLANIEDYSGGGVGNAIGVVNSTQGIWQRRVMQSGPAATTVTSCNVLLYPGACGDGVNFLRLADSGTIYYRNPRVEFINYDPDPNSAGFDSGFTSTNNINLVNDTSGRGNNATFSGTGSAPLYSSDNGGSWIFDGSNDTLVTGNSGITGNNPWSVSVWVNVNSSENGAGRQGWIAWEGAATQTTNQLIAIGVNGGKVEVAHWGNDTTFSNSPINFNQFQNIVVTFDGTIERIYVNSVNTDNKNTTLSVTDGAWYIGSAANDNGFLNCRVSQFQVYNRALTATEVAQNFNANRGRYGI